MNRQMTRVIEWLRYKASLIAAPLTAKVRLRNARPSKILILCYGNIYRSPFVEYYLRSLVPEECTLEIKSAGFHHKEDRCSVEEYVNLCKKWGIDLSQHRSKRLNKELLNWADLVFIMDGQNYKMTRMLDRNAASRIIWMGSISKHTPTEIKDPYGKPYQHQEMVVKQLAKASRDLAKFITR